MAESMVFSPWSRTVIPFLSLCKKIQAFQDENRQTSAWNKGHARYYFSAPTQPKCRHTLGKTRTRWSNWRNGFNLIKRERYNTQEWDTTDFKKIDIVKPIPKRLCPGSPKGCMYCKFNAPHPSVIPSDWSSEDWDGNKAKAREQRPLLHFKLLEQQIQKTLQDTTQDAPQDTTHNTVVDKQETYLIDRIQDLTLEPNKTHKIWQTYQLLHWMHQRLSAKKKIGKTNQWQHQHTKWQIRRSDYSMRMESMGSTWAPSVMKEMILTWIPRQTVTPMWQHTCF